MNIRDVVFYGHQTVLGTIDGLDEKDWTTPGVCGVWSVRDLVAHLASYEQVLVDVLRTLLGGEPSPALKRFAEAPERFNDEQVAARRDLSVAETVGEYTDRYEEVMALLERLPPDLPERTGTLPWYGDGYSLDDFVVYTFYGHKREHCAQINVFRDGLT